jgi:DNA-directed RNA polymerase II subunit RPB1
MLTHSAALCLLCAAQGVSENIMLGQLCPLGTGAFDLLLNEDELAAATDLMGIEQELDGSYGYGYGDGGMTPGRTPGHMTPSRTPYMTPNRWVSAGHMVHVYVVQACA